MTGCDVLLAADCHVVALYDTRQSAFSDDFWAVMELVLRFARQEDRFRHAEESLCFQRFPVVSLCPGCVSGRFRVNYSLAAARRVVPRLGCFEVGEWWWFENSRAYLYYFFIVNDCQFIVRSFASGREALKDGEVFVRCAFPYKAIVNFLVFESHMLAFCKVFLWRVRFWLRMNAGGVLNTCKSNGIHQALLGGESGERVSNA